MGVDLRKFYFDNKFKIEDKFAYGIYKDRTMSIIERSNFVKVSIGFNTQLQKETGSQISLKLRELKSKHRALQHAVTTNVCVELIIYQSADANIEFFEVLNDVINVLDQYHPEKVEVCPICGQIKPSNSPFVKIKDTVIQGHDHCIEQLISASNQMGASLLLKFDKKEFIKSLLVAFIALLVVVGVICIGAYYGIFAYISVLSGWGTYLIYNLVLKKMKTQVRKHQIIIITVFSILSILLSMYFGSIIDIYRTVDNVTLGFVFKNYFTIMIQNISVYGRYILIDLVLALLFLIPTLISNFKQLSESINAIKKLK